MLLAFLALATAPSAAVTIHSDFEGGSIGRIEQLAPTHFRCSVKGEVDQDKRNRQASWYYFRVDGAAGRELTIDFVDLPGEYNYVWGSLPITGDTRPLVSYDRKTWTVLEPGAVAWDKSVPSLRVRFTPKQAPVWVAHIPPYTNTDLARLLADAKRHPDAAVEEVGKSAGGRPMLLLTITNRAAAEGRKRVLWMMARQHAWESGTSWVTEGAVRFLLSGDPAAARLRDTCVFKILPMMDPDGVARGGVRYNVNGYDVNRNWDTVDPKLMPEIAAARRAIFGWLDGGRRIDFFLTLHNTSSDYLAGPVTAAGPLHREAVDRFAGLLAKDTVFDAKATRDRDPGKTAKGRQEVVEALFVDRGIPGLLLEQNVRPNAKIGRPCHIDDYLKFGRQMIQALAASVTQKAGVAPAASGKPRSASGRPPGHPGGRKAAAAQ